MLAGSTRWSMFSPARTCPVSKSISSQALAPLGTGAGGTGMAVGAGWPGVGRGVWAEATATKAAEAAANRQELRRKGGTPVKRGFYVLCLIPDHPRLRQFQLVEAFAQAREIVGGHRTDAHAPQVPA